MCMPSSNQNQQILQQQQQQQSTIDTGMQQLNNIFQGGTVGVNPVAHGAAINPTQTYYTALGQPVQGTGAGKLEDQGGLYQGIQQEKGFGPDFYQQRQQQYLNYADPQVYQQYQQTLGQLGSQLGDAGLVNSSVGQHAQNSLKGELNTQLSGQANQALSQSQGLQQNIAQEQSMLANQLQNSANPSQTSVQALSAASNFNSPPILAPLGNLFGQWSQLYGANQLQNNLSALQNSNNQNFSLLNLPQSGFAGLGQNSIQ